MKTITLLALWAIFSISLFAQTPQFSWGTLVGGNQDDRGRDMTVDHDGNVLTTGFYFEQGDFDPSEEEFILTSNGGQDIFVQKLSPDGDFLWAISIGSDANLEKGGGIGVDSENNVYLAGTFLNETDFDPGEGEFILNPGTNEDAFLLKLDPDGNFIWVKQFGGPILSYGEELAIDADDNIAIVGYFNGSCDFDPGDEVFERTSAGQFDYFVVKVNSYGEFIWAATGGGTEYDYAYDVAMDPSGNVFVAGDFNGTADFDPGDEVLNLTSNGNVDGYIAKFSAEGEFEWVRREGGPTSDPIRSVACDSEGNVIATGYFSQNVDFDPGEGVVEVEATNGSPDAFFWKLDTDGELVWVKTIQGDYKTYGMAIFVDAEDNIYGAGELTNTSDFDTGEGELLLSSVGQDDVYVVRLDPSGDTDWAYAYGGINNNWVRGIAVSDENRVVTSGVSGGNIDFDQSSDEFIVPLLGFGDIFIQSSQQSGLSTSNQTEVELAVYPIPANDMLRVKSEVNILRYEIINLGGKSILSSPYAGKSINLDVSGILPGVYLLFLETEKGVVKAKWIK